jgi:hypothetical protein
MYYIILNSPSPELNKTELTFNTASNRIASNMPKTIESGSDHAARLRRTEVKPGSLDAIFLEICDKIEGKEPHRQRPKTLGELGCDDDGRPYGKPSGGY